MHFLSRNFKNSICGYIVSKTCLAMISTYIITRFQSKSNIFFKRANKLRDWKRYENTLKATSNNYHSRFACGQHILYDNRKKTMGNVFLRLQRNKLARWRCLFKIYDKFGNVQLYCAGRPTKNEREKQCFCNEYCCLTFADSKPF